MTKILLVDDDPGALTLFTIMLQKGGFEVLTATDADSTLEMLKTLTPDLFILDIAMPGMDGVELLRAIRSQPETQDKPVVMLTARGDIKTVNDAIKSGADAYIVKPIIAEDLLNKVRDLLSHREEE